MTILIDRASASRLSKHLRRTANLPSHSVAMQAVARALDFRDDNAMSAALRDNGVATLKFPIRKSKVTKEFLKAFRPTPAAVAENVRRMLLSVNLSPRQVPPSVSLSGEEDNSEAASACFIALTLGSASAWFGCSIILPHQSPKPMHLLEESIIQRFDTSASHQVMFDIHEMAARAGVLPDSLGEAFGLELSYEMNVSATDDVDEEVSFSTAPNFAILLACRMSDGLEGADDVGWDAAVPFMLKSFIGRILVNENPMFGCQLPLTITGDDDQQVTVLAYALRGGIGEPFRFHAVHEGMEIPSMMDNERNARSPFNFMIMR